MRSIGLWDMDCLAIE
ncbi:unnamed protein product, partial [Onchocerca ochengi]|uniref:Uncharacterized protein n=1 Tax=Onchocerca ochengi TaxID=42157 RepID=A0A182F0E5_ONCOC